MVDMLDKQKARRDREPILKFFTYDYLPPRLAQVVVTYRAMAETLVEVLPRNPERTVALRKLLESKDAAVAAGLYV